METMNDWFDTYISLLAAESLAKQANAPDLKHAGMFQAGEIVELRGRRFRIVGVTCTQLSLRLLPQGDISDPE